MPIDQLRNRVVELSEDLECSEKTKEEAMELVRELGTRLVPELSITRLEMRYLPQGCVRSEGESTSRTRADSYESSPSSFRERVERERRAEHSILKSELQTCKKKIASMRQEKEALEKRLRLAEKSAKMVGREREVKSLNLRLELRVKSQENEARRSCQRNPRIRTRRESSLLKQRD